MTDTSCHCIVLRRASRRISAIYDAALKPLGITIGQFSMLRNIDRAGPVSLTALGTRMELDRSTVGRNVRVLQRMKLVQSTVGEDQREALLELSDGGKIAIERGKPLWDKAQTQIAARIDGNEQTLHEILARL